MATQFRAGDVRERNGYQYQRQDDGTWVPISQSAAPVSMTPLAPPDPRRAAADARAERAEARADAAAARAERADARSAAAFASQQEQRQAGRPLWQGEGNTLRETAGLVATLGAARDNFQDDFAGNLVGGIENTLQGLNSNIGTPGQRDWWAAFRRSDIGERNALFGATLTPSENAAFTATTVSERMDPVEVRRNIDRRYQAAVDSLNRQREFLIANGYSQAAVDALIGPTVLGTLPGVARPSEPQGAAQNEAPAAPPAVGNGDRLDRSAQTISTGGDEGQDRLELTAGEYRSENDPALAGVNRRLSAMLVGGTPDDEIRAYISSLGIPLGEIPQLEEALTYRRTPQFREWRARNPGQGWSVNIDDRLIPMTPVRRAVADIADSPLGAAAISAGNVVTGQRLDNIVGATGGNAELARAGIAEVRRRNPISSFAGDIAGGASLYGAGRNIAARVLPAAIGSGAPATATLSGRAIVGDLALGAYEGSGLDDANPVRGALTGATVAGSVGVASRGAINALGRSVSPTGGELAEAYAEGVQPTVGQRMGGMGNRIEQAFASIPVVGGVQRSSRQRALDQWERGAFNRALRNLPGQSGNPLRLPDTVPLGRDAHAFTQDAFNRAYTRVHRRLRVQDDPELQTSLATLRAAADTLSDDSRGRFERILESALTRRLNNAQGSLSGDDMQAAMSEIGGLVRRINSSPAGDRELSELLGDLEGAIRDNARRHSPRAAVRALDRVDTGYAHLVRIEKAAASGGARDAGRFSPSHLMNVERREGGLRSRAFLRGDGLMDRYAEAGLRLGQTVPDSGTAERAMTGLAATGGVGGAFAVSPLLAAPWAANTFMNLPGVRGGVNALLAPNRSALAGLRSEIQDRAYLGPVIAVPSALSFYAQ